MDQAPCLASDGWLFIGRDILCPVTSRMPRIRKKTPATAKIARWYVAKTCPSAESPRPSGRKTVRMPRKKMKVIRKTLRLSWKMEAKYAGRSTVTQQGAKSAAMPATNAAMREAPRMSSIGLRLGAAAAPARGRADVLPLGRVQPAGGLRHLLVARGAGIAGAEDLLRVRLGPSDPLGGENFRDGDVLLREPVRVHLERGAVHVFLGRALRRHELHKPQHGHAVVAIRKVGAVAAAGPVDVLRDPLHFGLRRGIQLEEAVHAVVVHRSALCQGPAAGGCKAPGAAGEARVHHLPLFQDLILVAKPERPKQVQDGAGVLAGHADPAVIRAGQHGLHVRSHTAAAVVQAFEFSLVDDAGRHHLPTQIAPGHGDLYAFGRGHAFFERHELLLAADRGDQLARAAPRGDGGSRDDGHAY